MCACNPSGVGVHVVIRKEMPEGGPNHPDAWPVHIEVGAKALGEEISHQVQHRIGGERLAMPSIPEVTSSSPFRISAFKGSPASARL